MAPSAIGADQLPRLLLVKRMEASTQKWMIVGLSVGIGLVLSGIAYYVITSCRKQPPPEEQASEKPVDDTEAKWGPSAADERAKQSAKKPSGFKKLTAPKGAKGGKGNVDDREPFAKFSVGDYGSGDDSDDFGEEPGTPVKQMASRRPQPQPGFSQYKKDRERQRPAPRQPGYSQPDQSW